MALMSNKREQPSGLSPPSSHGDLHDKIAIVTGATQGIGAGVARLFAERGVAGLVLTGRRAAEGKGIADELTSAGTSTEFVAAELGDLAGLRAVVDRALTRFGRVDVLVNAGGSTHRGTLANTTAEVWDMLFAVNVRGPFFLTQWVVESMRDRAAGGSIVNIISQASHVASADLIGYGASKGALANLTRSLALALGPERIRVNGLNIGWSNTPGEHAVRREFHGDTDGSWLEAASATQPFGRLLEIDEIARAVAFIASDESGLMTGSVIDFDQSVFGLATRLAP
jgi:NAD(P)-dependent dehydrogenase (short-subunit alcohol dehydrogenase family)